MELLNELNNAKSSALHGYRKEARYLSAHAGPCTAHCRRIVRRTGHPYSIHNQAAKSTWKQPGKEIMLIVQVNGKLRTD